MGELSHLCKYGTALVIFQCLRGLLVLWSQGFAVAAPGCIEFCHQKIAVFHRLLKFCVAVDGQHVLRLLCKTAC